MIAGFFFLGLEWLNRDPVRVVDVGLFSFFWVCCPAVVICGLGVAGLLLSQEREGCRRRV